MIQSSAFRDPVEELCEEFLSRRRSGELVTMEEYAALYPEWSEGIRRLFPTVMMLEGLKMDPPAPPLPQQHWGEDLRHGVRKFGDFLITQEIGRGGMGVVYEAFQKSLERRVALKVTSPGLLHSKIQIRRFQREATAAANLHHTNIIPVFGYGERDSVHYYVMQHIDGTGLDALLREPPQPEQISLPDNWQYIAQLGQDIASALHYAHEQGVLHRDIKPANLILDTSGVIWLSDFGLAKAVWQDEITSPGDAVGTLRYMSPEQLEGTTDRRSDVYSLGLTLYELLTWNPAFAGKDRAQLVTDIIQTRPTPPREINPSIPRDLETIILKAIEYDPHVRYQTAEELAEDLQRFILGKPIHARRVSVVGQLWRWSKRNRAAASFGLSTLSLCLIIAVTSYLGAAAYRSARQRELELKQQVVTAEQRALMEQQRASANLQMAMTAMNEVAYDLAQGIPSDSPQAFDRESPEVPELVSTVSHDAVLNSLVRFYEEFATQNSNHPTMQQQLVQAYRRLGDIHQQLGKLEAAEKAYCYAIERYCTLSEEDSTAPFVVIERTTLCLDLGQVYLRQGRYSDAKKIYLETQFKLADFLESTPDSAEAQFALARSEKQLADLRRKAGKIE